MNTSLHDDSERHFLYLVYTTDHHHHHRVILFAQLKIENQTSCVLSDYYDQVFITTGGPDTVT